MHESIRRDMDEVMALLKKESVIRGLNLPDDAPLIREGGKLLRPRLLVTAAHVCGTTNQDHIRAAAAAELMHNATLFHDDVIDHAAIRRGKPSLNSRMGDDTAILVGDHYVALSFFLAAQTGNSEIVKNLADCLVKIVFGQLKEFEHECSPDCGLDDYFQIIDNKTAILLKTCAVCGALAAGVEPGLVNHLGRIADAAGRLFQIADDVIDYLLDESKTGKRRFQDVREGKMTIPAIFLVEKCAPDQKKRFFDLLGRDDLTEEQGLEILSFMEQTGVFPRILERYKTDHAALVQDMDALAPNEFTSDFREIMDLVVGRLYPYMDSYIV